MAAKFLYRVTLHEHESERTFALGVYKAEGPEKACEMAAKRYRGTCHNFETRTFYLRATATTQQAEVRARRIKIQESGLFD